MTGGYEFHLIQAIQDQKEVNEDFEASERRLNEQKLRKNDLQRDIVQACFASYKSVRGYFDDEDEERTPDGDIKISGKRFLEVFEDKLLKFKDIEGDYIERVDEYNKNLKNLRIVNKRIETLRHLIRRSYGDSNVNKAVLDLTPVTIGYGKEETKAAKAKLLTFLSENKSEIPTYVREYVETWMSENS